MKLKLYTILLVLISASFLITGCTETVTPPPSELPPAGELEGVTWILESYGEPGNLNAVLEGTEITLSFDGIEGQIHGNAGANSYFGDYQTDGDRISIAQIAATEMYRMDPEGVMDQEYSYLRILQSAESYEIEDGALWIHAGGQVLIFTGQPKKEEPSVSTDPDTTVTKTREEDENSTSVSESPAVDTGTEEVKGPELAEGLTSNCQNADTGDFRKAGLAVGELAIDFTLKDIDGQPVSLSGLLSEKPVMMVFGSFT